MVCIFGESRLLVTQNCVLFSDPNMKKALKIVILTAVALIAIGCFSFAFASSQGYLPASNNQLLTNQQISQFLKTHPGVAVEAFGRFINHSQLAEVNGTVVAQYKGMAVLQTTSGQVTVLLPNVWNYNGQLLNRTELFDNTFTGTGQTVTFKVLKGQWNENGFNLNIMIGYEALNAASAHAYAVLPFNIEAITS